MTALWPDDLPCWALPESVAGSLTDGLLRTQPDTGPAKIRLLTSASPTPVSAQIMCDSDKLARFQRFWLEDISRGVDPFVYRDQMFDQKPLSDEDGVPLTDEDDNPLLNDSWWLVGFSAAPSFQAVVLRKFYRITLQLEILP